MRFFGWNSTKELLPPECDSDLYFPQYDPTRQKCATPAFTVIWVQKVNSVRDVPPRVRADPPPLTAGLPTTEQQLADPYQVCASLFGSDALPTRKNPKWVAKCSANGRRCSLCLEVDAIRLVPCCACENWVHLECSYGIPEGRLCASHCHIIDPLKGNCPRGELRCLVPWRPWAKKNKLQWEVEYRPDAGNGCEISIK